MIGISNSYVNGCIPAINVDSDIIIYHDSDDIMHRQRVEVIENDGQFEIYFSDAEILLMEENLVKQSIEIVRRRVDESGTKEPTIQAQGQNRILLQEILPTE